MIATPSTTEKRVTPNPPLANIPQVELKRVVIVGGGFGGLKLARSLAGKEFQVVLLDKVNYHQFQPLFYQVATAGLEPSSISFPFRKVFQRTPNMAVRMAELKSIDAVNSTIQTDLGEIAYDYLILATGADTNYFGNKNIQEFALPMKSITEALAIRNRILDNYEKALNTRDESERQTLMNIVVVGGGPTGVEVSGTLAEMKKGVLPKDYPELDFKPMKIYLIEASGKLLNGMSEQASASSRKYLERLGVTVMTGASVTDYDGQTVTLGGGAAPLHAATLVWAAGVTGIKLDGLPQECFVRGNRIQVDRTNRVNGLENVYALGDIAYMTEESYPNGHPQVAQVAIQQAANLARNLKRIDLKQDTVPFSYKNLGSMATIGRNKAVADLPHLKFHGFVAWLFWMFVHLMSIVGIKNKLVTFINWAWNYFTSDQSLRLIIRPEQKKATK